MIEPARIAAELHAIADKVERDGPAAWKNAAEWTRPGQPPTRGERGGGIEEGVCSDDRAAERRDDARASKMLKRMQSDAAEAIARLTSLLNRIEECAKPGSNNLATREKQATQIAADGWCVSCWRAGGLVEIATRPTGEAYYRDRCRTCGTHRAETGEDPPLEHVRARLDGKRVRVKA